ncbi:MAG: hypothetical protein V1913_08410 [Fibrobacterota bacterium]
MGKAVLILLTFIAITVTVIADLVKRASDGIPDYPSTRIRTLALSRNIKAGAASADITGLLMPVPLPVPAFEEERIINPGLAEYTTPEKGTLTRKPKIINRFFLKVLVFGSDKQLAACISAELPSLSPECLNAARTALRNEFGMDAAYLLFYSAGLNASIEIRPTDFAIAVAQCVRTAVVNLQPVEMAVVRTAEPAFPAAIRHLSVGLAGGFDLPIMQEPLRNDSMAANPMAGPDPARYANRWLFTLTGDSGHFPAGSLKAVEMPPQATTCIIFRSAPDRIAGGLILAPYPPATVRTTWPEISSDYIPHLCGFLEKKLGGTFLFARSPGTDILPMPDNASFSLAQRVGIRLGTALMTPLKKAPWVPLSEAFFYQRPLALPLKPWASLSLAELRQRHTRYYRQAQEARGLELDLPVKRDLQDKYLTAYYLYEYFSRGGKTPAPVLQAVRFGEQALLLGLPAQCGSATGAALSAAPGRLQPIVSDHCGGPLFPVVPSEQFNGGYASNRSPFTAKAETELRREAINLIRAVQPNHP